MKKLIIFFLFLGAVISAGAQFRYAPLIGYNNTTLKFNQDLINVNHVSGFRAGVQGELMFPGIGFGLDIGALYSMDGAQVNLGQKEIWASEGYTDSRVYLHNLEIPVNLKFKWTRMQGLEEYIAPYVFGGPTFDFLLGHSHIKAIDYHVLTLGLQVGIGFEILKKWQIQGEYNWGMSTQLKTVKLDDFSAKNRRLSITLLRYF